MNHSDGNDCRVPWGEALLSMAATKEQHDSTTGQVLLRGLSAKIGISNGPITRLCPHAVTGTLAQLALHCSALPCSAICYPTLPSLLDAVHIMTGGI